MVATWYKLAAKTSKNIDLGDGLIVRLITAPLLTCTKLEAHKSRGGGDLKESKDFGDILAIIDGRVDLFDEVRLTEETARKYLVENFQRFLDDELGLRDSFT